jgi:phage replication initiation protein
MSATQTTVDWLGFRTQAEVPDAFQALRGLFGEMAPALNLRHLPRGRDGFQQASEIRVHDLAVGRLDFGGESQRGWVRCNLTGQGCEWVTDWDAVDQLEGLPRAEIRRLDVALTTWKGEVGHDRVEAAHAAGLFCSGGRPPNLQRIMNSDPRTGDTCYVGERKESDKYFRGYEKGLELASKLGAFGRTITHIDGCAVEDIYRCEVELKAANRPIPWEVVGRRDQYFAGCYPFLAELLPEVGCDILMRRKERAPQAELMAALANVRTQYGATLFTALKAFGGDYLRVWDAVVGNHDNEALLAAGVLVVDHE